jgi:hypothetical protein
VATSTATFFRSMGGSLGVALLGAIFASRLTSELAALPADAAARFAGGGVNISPDEVHALTPEVREDFLLAFVHALQPVFLVGAALTALTFALAWMLAEVPLRVTTHTAAELGGEGAIAGDTAAEAVAVPVSADRSAPR